MGSPYPSYQTAVSLATMTPEDVAKIRERIRFQEENERLQRKAEARTAEIENKKRAAAATAAGSPYYLGAGGGSFIDPTPVRSVVPPTAPPLPAPPSSRPPNVAAAPARVAPGNQAAGPDTAVTEEAAGNEPPREKPTTYHDRVKAVRLPSGRIVFTNQPGEYERAEKPEYRGTQVDYGEAMEAVTGRPFRGGVNVATGSEGTAFVQPGGEAAVTRALGPEPEVEAPQSLDPVDVWEREQWRLGRGEMLRAERSQEARVAAQEAAAQEAEQRAAVDPLEYAQLEAESRYGGQMIETEAAQAETMQALRIISRITAEQNRLRTSVPPGPERDAAIEQLENDKKLYLIAVRPQAAAGLMRPDPYAMFAAMPAPGPAEKSEKKK